jgi:hypothetical protein
VSVRHDEDGTIGWYEARELRELKPDPLDNIKHPDALREVARAAIRAAANAHRLLRRLAADDYSDALRRESAAFLRDFDARVAEDLGGTRGEA